MFGTKKLKVLIWSVTISLSLLASCGKKELIHYTISGDTQGTTYTLIIVDEGERVTKKSIDSLFHDFDLILSTYIDESIISQINNSDTTIDIKDHSGYFERCYNQAGNIFTQTNGAFDPSVFPLVEGWGFMKNMETPLDSVEVDSLMQYVDFTENHLHSITFNNQLIKFKKAAGFKLDFNAIAQGLSVDVVDEYLQKKGLQNYYIEIGGELLVRGKNREGKKWRIGIDTPIENQKKRSLENILTISNKAIATSGNYRKFYEIDGVKYSHTLNPKTGWPVRHNLLSATVIADNCADADAFATAFMVLGVDSTFNLIQKNQLGIDAYLIYTNEKGDLTHRYTAGFSQYLN